MSAGQRKHLPVSVRQRLRNLRDKTGEDYQLLLTTYAVERLLYRLSQSEYADRFVLKGAMLFVALTGKSHRVTRDLDLLGYGMRRQNILHKFFGKFLQHLLNRMGWYSIRRTSRFRRFVRTRCTRASGYV